MPHCRYLGAGLHSVCAYVCTCVCAGAYVCHLGLVSILCAFVCARVFVCACARVTAGILEPVSTSTTSPTITCRPLCHRDLPVPLSGLTFTRVASQRPSQPPLSRRRFLTQRNSVRKSIVAPGRSARGPPCRSCAPSRSPLPPAGTEPRGAFPRCPARPMPPRKRR
jgi:hypothetical protein